MLKLLLTWGSILCVYVTARTTLTNNILHLSAAWMLDALGSSANNPLPQILNWLLSSQWHKPINESCCLLRTVVLDPKREKKKKTLTTLIKLKGLSSLLRRGTQSKYNQHICVKMENSFCGLPYMNIKKISTLYFNCRIKRHIFWV